MEVQSPKSCSENKAAPSLEKIRKSLPKNFCPLPFKQLFLYPTGEVYTCCEIGFKLGEAQKTRIEDIWNGEKAQRLREEFLAGEPRICSSQIKNKRCHLANEHLLEDLELTKIQSQPAQAFDLMLNGKCNLECVMCPVWTLPNQIYDQSSFWEEGESHIFKNLKQVSVKSGEPFIQKDTYRLIARVAAVNKTCRWQFTTNGQYKLTSRILDHLDLVDLDCIRVSIDSLDEDNYKKIRIRGDLKKTLATLEGLAEYRRQRERVGRNFELAINMAVQRRNWQEVPALIDRAVRVQATPIFLYVYTPEKESLGTLPEEERLRIAKFYFDFLADNTDYSRSLGTLMRPLLGSLPDQLRFEAILHWKEAAGSVGAGSGSDTMRAPSSDTMRPRAAPSL